MQSKRLLKTDLFPLSLTLASTMCVCAETSFARGMSSARSSSSGCLLAFPVYRTGPRVCSCHDIFVFDLNISHSLSVCAPQQCVRRSDRWLKRCSGTAAAAIMMATDVGGFAGTPSPELAVRWHQFGSVCPLYRSHGASPREPWVYGPEAEASITKSINLR